MSEPVSPPDPESSTQADHQSPVPLGRQHSGRQAQCVTLAWYSHKMCDNQQLYPFLDGWPDRPNLCNTSAISRSSTISITEGPCWPTTSFSRTEATRVGKECVSSCRARSSTSHKKKK